MGHAFSRVTCGDRWYVATRGRGHGRPPMAAHAGPWPHPAARPGCVEAVGAAAPGPLQLPPAVKYDGICLYTVRGVSEDEYVKADFIDRLLDGYARPLFLHQRRKS
jgi:hypothetical protein